MKRLILASALVVLMASGATAKKCNLDCTLDLIETASLEMKMDLAEAVAHQAEANAVNSALQGGYLKRGEAARVWANLGFNDDETAIGAGVVFNLYGGWDANAAAAVSTNDSDVWSGRVGMSYGWDK